MDTTLTPIITPAEAFARARAALDAHEALIPGLDALPDPVIADANRVIVELLRAQVAASEALIAACPDAGVAFAAGYSTGLLVGQVASATGHMPESVKP